MMIDIDADEDNNDDTDDGGIFSECCTVRLMMMVFFQRVLYSEMSINQCQTGVDDLPDIPPELFDTGRSKLGHKGWMFVSFMQVGCSSFHCNICWMVSIPLWHVSF